MSYRLIDANAIASQRPEVNDMPCVYADLPSGLDGGHYDMRESDELQRENAKLRRLCVKALEWLRWAGGITCPPEVPDEFADELRKLGIEVDE